MLRQSYPISPPRNETNISFVSHVCIFPCENFLASSSLSSSPSPAPPPRTSLHTRAQTALGHPKNPASRGKSLACLPGDKGRFIYGPRVYGAAGLTTGNKYVLLAAGVFLRLIFIEAPGLTQFYSTGKYLLIPDGVLKFSFDSSCKKC